MNFKIGDRVRLRNRYGKFPAGTTGTIAYISRMGETMLEVAVDIPGFTPLAAFAHRFELIQETTMNTDGIEFDEPSTPTIEQAQLFLGKKVIVRDGRGNAMYLGRVTELKQTATGAYPGPVILSVKNAFAGAGMNFQFESYTFEEVE